MPIFYSDRYQATNNTLIAPDLLSPWSSLEPVLENTERSIVVGGSLVSIKSNSDRTTTSVFNLTEALHWTYLTQAEINPFISLSLVLAGFKIYEAGNQFQSSVCKITNSAFDALEQNTWEPLTSTNAPTTIGQVIQSFQLSDHNGWIKLNGRLRTTLTLVQQNNCALFFGVGSTIPNMEDKTLVGSSSSKLMNSSGGNPTATLVQANLPNISLTSNSGGSHSHTYVEADGSSSLGCGDGSRLTNEISIKMANRSTTSAGSHTHSISLNGSSTPFSIQNPYLAINYFVYLG